MTSSSAPNLTLPKSFHYPFHVLFAVMSLGWALLALLALFLTLVTSFSFASLPIPGKMEIIVMLIISALAAFKLRYTNIISLTDTGISQGNYTIAYEDIQKIEHIHKWYLYVIAFHSTTHPEQPIFLVCPKLLKNYTTFFTHVSERTQQDIRPH